MRYRHPSVSILHYNCRQLFSDLQPLLFRLYQLRRSNSGWGVKMVLGGRSLIQEGSQNVQCICIENQGNVARSISILTTSESKDLSRYPTCGNGCVFCKIRSSVIISFQNPDWSWLPAMQSVKIRLQVRQMHC